uniref:Uncharacterized protein n=1 Tax=Anguilla anguilla TaxID=7936 RepID=A0A0E9PQD0_ANGAN
MYVCVCIISMTGVLWNCQSILKQTCWTHPALPLHCSLQ